jgi:hypothetical protein
MGMRSPDKQIFGCEMGYPIARLYGLPHTLSNTVPPTKESEMAKLIGSIETPYGSGAVMARKYGSNGALAVVIEPQIATVSVNLDHGQPCTQSGDLPDGHFYVDTNNLAGRMLDALKTCGLFAETDLPEGVSGYCTYPVWRLVAQPVAA